MTTSDRDRVSGRSRGDKLVRGLVVAVVVGALVFGGYLGYLAYSNDAFPTHQRPFSEYARVVSANFNGTELAFQVQWLRSDSLPLFAQLTSTDVDAANSPVCDIGISSVQAGQSSFMPFAVTKHLQVITNAELSVAVKSVVNGTEFTIVYPITSIQANPGNISPSNISCSQPVGVE